QGIYRSIYGYAKGSNELLVVECGKGGLEEMIENFDETQVLYGFAKVIDENTRLPKFVFIAWCPEGAAMNRRSQFNIHSRQVAQKLKGFHVEIVARNEFDIKPEVIKKKIRDSSGAKFSIHQ
ncbi:actin depolymerizing protein, partial [Rozella allomycis CSF55]